MIFKHEEMGGASIISADFREKKMVSSKSLNYGDKNLHFIQV